MPVFQLDLTITNPDGQKATISQAFTFVPAPSITSISPSSGPMAGGTAVTITGTDFQQGASVLFGAKPATSVVVVDSSHLTCVTPAQP